MASPEKCKQCDGKGLVQDFYTLLQKTCPECQGTGEDLTEGEKPFDWSIKIEEPPQ